MSLGPTRCLRRSMAYLLACCMEYAERVLANQSHMHTLPDFIGKLSNMHGLKMDGWPNLYVSNCSTHFAIIWLRTSTLGYSSQVDATRPPSRPLPLNQEPLSAR